MRLVEHERRSDLWRKIESHLKERRETLRTLNEGDLSELETAKLRGRLDEIKGILSLGEERPAVENGRRQ